jgi:hypothetical protein
VTALSELRSESMRGNHMAPGASCSQNEIHQAVCSPLHFTT